MRAEAEVAAKLRAHIKKDVPGVKARVRLSYTRHQPSILVDIDSDEFIDRVIELAEKYTDELLGVCVNGRWVYPDDEDDHTHLFDE